MLAFAAVTSSSDALGGRDQPDAKRLGQHEPVARPGAGVGDNPVRMNEAGDRETALEFHVLGRVTAGHDRARLAHLVPDPAQHRRDSLVADFTDRVADDAERGQRHAAHRVDIAQGIGRGNLTEGPRIVGHRREHVHSEHQRSFVIKLVDTGIVRRISADKQTRVGENGKLTQYLHQVFLTHLARSAGSARVVNQPSLGHAGSHSNPDDAAGGHHRFDQFVHVRYGPDAYPVLQLVVVETGSADADGHAGLLELLQRVQHRRAVNRQRHSTVRQQQLGRQGSLLGQGPQKELQQQSAQLRTAGTELLAGNQYHAAGRRRLAGAVVTGSYLDKVCTGRGLARGDVPTGAAGAALDVVAGLGAAADDPDDSVRVRRKGGTRPDDRLGADQPANVDLDRGRYLTQSASSGLG
jgi:hypothetical protein